MAARARRRDGEPIRITTAPPSRAEDTSARQRHYLISMGIRTACFVGAVVAHGWVRWVMIAGAVLLPYVAVVVANTSSRGGDAIDLPGAPLDQRHLPGGASGGR